MLVFIVIIYHGIGGSYTFNGITVLHRNASGSGLILFYFNSTDISDLVAFIKRANQDGRIEDIHDMFIVPVDVIDPQILTTASFIDVDGTTTHSCYLAPNNNFVPYIKEHSITKVTSYSDYTPKNNKCFVYPYNYLYVTNNQGDYNTYKYEDFSTTACKFGSEFVVSIGGSGKLVPLNYKGIASNNDESVNIGKFPTLSWSSDSFTNWLTQNAVNIENKGLNTALNVGSNLAEGNVAGALTSIATTAMSMHESFYSASLLPQKIGGSNSGDCSFSFNDTEYKVLNMRCKLEYLRQIDDFFSRFGYKINRLKVPNITGRRNFNYIEISPSDEFGIGNVPNKFMEEINGLARRGLTIWHNHENVGNYLVQNDIV